MLKSLRWSIAVGVLALGLPLGLIATSANAATARPALNAAPSAKTLSSAPAHGAASKVMQDASETSCINNPSNANCNGVWISETDACYASSYIVQPNNGGEYIYSQNGYTFETDLRYSTACKSNFSVTTVLASGWGIYDYSGKVRRASGPDGPYLMEHGGWATATASYGGPDVLSPLVYSPNNLAQACFSNDTSDQVGCTGWF